MEDVQQRVTANQRMWQINFLTQPGMESLHKLIALIAELTENAYIAGANRVNITEGEKMQITDTGTIRVLAGCYCKDKGLKI